MDCSSFSLSHHSLLTLKYYKQNKKFENDIGQFLRHNLYKINTDIVDVLFAL